MLITNKCLHNSLSIDPQISDQFLITRIKYLKQKWTSERGKRHTKETTRNVMDDRCEILLDEWLVFCTLGVHVCVCVCEEAEFCLQPFSPLPNKDFHSLAELRMCLMGTSEVK